MNHHQFFAFFSFLAKYLSGRFWRLTLRKLQTLLGRLLARRFKLVSTGGDTFSLPFIKSKKVKKNSAALFPWSSKIMYYNNNYQYIPKTSIKSRTPKYGIVVFILVNSILVLPLSASKNQVENHFFKIKCKIRVCQTCLFLSPFPLFLLATLFSLPVSLFFTSKFPFLYFPVLSFFRIFPNTLPFLSPFSVLLLSTLLRFMNLLFNPLYSLSSRDFLLQRFGMALFQVYSSKCILTSSSTNLKAIKYYTFIFAKSKAKHLKNRLTIPKPSYTETVFCNFKSESQGNPMKQSLLNVFRILFTLDQFF